MRSPEVTLFSDPALMQSERLAYVVLGRPLGTASVSEGGLVAEVGASLGITLSRPWTLQAETGRATRADLMYRIQRGR